MSKQKAKTYSNKELGVILNNATVAAFGVPTLKGLDEKRKQKLRYYLSAILEGLMQHVTDGEVKAEELVATLASGALFVHILMVCKGGENKLAMYQDIAAQMIEDDKGKNE